MPPQKIVCLLHGGRCGSTVLGDLLDQHPEVSWKSEIVTIEAEKARRNVESPPDYLAWLEKTIPQWGLESFHGFELKFENFAPFSHGNVLPNVRQTISWLTSTFDCQVIVLKRRNFLRRTVSALLAERSGIWHVNVRDQTTGHASSGKTEPIFIDPDSVGFYKCDLLDLFGRYDCFYREASEALTERAPLMLTYEADIATDPLVAYQKVCRHLGLDSHDPAVRYTKTGDSLLKNLIENLDDLRARLENTSYQWMAE